MCGSTFGVKDAFETLKHILHLSRNTQLALANKLWFKAKQLSQFDWSRIAVRNGSNWVDSLILPTEFKSKVHGAVVGLFAPTFLHHLHFNAMFVVAAFLFAFNFLYRYA